MRRPNIGSAGSDFGFAILALAAGWLGLPAVFAGMVFASAIAAWAWTRRRPLSAMTNRQRISQGAIAVAMIAVVLALAYWIGLMLGGHT